MTNTIVCPHCGTSIEITQALRGEIEREVTSDIAKQTEEKLRKEFSEKNSIELADLKNQLQEKDKKVAELRDQELSLREEKRKIEEEKKELKLEVARQIDEERKKLEEAILKQAAEEHRLRDQEKEKIINDLKKSLEDAQRKANQGSQQLQGEVQELDLETTLRNAIPSDIFEPIGKGMLGADIRQTVKTQRGNTCGTILWESKRTKAWSDGWITKLKEDSLHDKANVAAIVSNILPEEANTGMGLKDGIWVCSIRLVVPLALLLHKAIEDTARQKFVSDRRQTDAERIYAVVTSHEFVQQVNSMMETYNEMLAQITRERTAFEKSWKLREAQINHLISGVSGIVGQIQEAAGPALPPVKSLELLEEPEKE